MIGLGNAELKSRTVHDGTLVGVSFDREFCYFVESFTVQVHTYAYGQSRG